MITIVADDTIPLIHDLLAHHCHLVSLPRQSITANVLQETNGLICRANLNVNAQLLGESSLDFVASPTSGIDHFDIDYFNQHDIAYFHAPGSNALAVAKYVLACVFALQKKGLLKTSHLHTGVIGVGHVGSLVSEIFDALGYSILQNDPLRMDIPSTPLSHFKSCDLITLHTPLTYSGPYPTYHLINHEFLENLKDNTVIINTSRGAVLDFSALKQRADRLIFCCDVFDNEPHIDLDYLKYTTICTPHIAGHTKDSKRLGTEMIVAQIADYYRWPIKPVEMNRIQKVQQKKLHLLETLRNKQNSSSEDIIKFDPFKQTEQMRTQLLSHPDAIPEQFHAMRQHYWDEPTSNSTINTR